MENLTENSLNSVLKQLPPNAQESIKSIISSQKYLTFKVNYKQISTDGNNFLGELYEVDINGQNTEGDHNIYLFLKHIIINDDFRVYSIPEVYKKEQYFYSELCEVYTQLQDLAKVPPQDRLHVPKIFDETNSNCIILENLSKKGYKTMAKMEIMSFDFAKLSIKQLAKLHGLSFVLQIKKPDYFEKRIKTVKQSFVYDEYWNTFVQNMYELSAARFNGIVRDKLDTFFKTSLDKYPQYMNGLNSKFKCLCHGDYKMNNILLKETNNVTTEVIPIDYQQIYYGSPVIDLIYFLYAASDRNFRENYLITLKDLYFETLMSFLQFFHIDVETVYPRREFEKCFGDSMDYALMYTLYMLPMFGFVKENPPSGKDDLMEIKLNVHDRFYVIMQEIVEDFIAMGIL